MSGAAAKLVFVALTACAQSQPAAAPPAPARADAIASEVERFLPLRNGDVLSFWVWTPASAEREQVIFRVERSSREHASLLTGNRSQRLELTGDGVRLLSGGYLLKAPLSLGAEWAGAAGRVRVSAVDVSVEVSAGRFVGCIETTEVGGAGLDARSIVTTYCPDVGITKMLVQAGEREERFELRSYGPGVDIDAM